MRTLRQASNLPTPAVRRPFRLAAAVTIGLWSAILLSQQAVAQVFVPGEVKLSYTFQGDPINMTSRDFADIPGMVLGFAVPQGKVAEVLVLFTGTVNSPDALYVRAVVDGVPTPQGAAQLFWPNRGGATSHGFNFKSEVSAGSHTVKMQWAGLGGQQFMINRSMTLILNTH